jgi:hypothetical protein
MFQPEWSKRERVTNENDNENRMGTALLLLCGSLRGPTLGSTSCTALVLREDCANANIASALARAAEKDMSFKGELEPVAMAMRSMGRSQ